MVTPYPLINRFECVYTDFERRCSLQTIVKVIDNAFPQDRMDTVIDSYRSIIRNNEWYFPTLFDVDVREFLTRWERVHIEYFRQGQEIFDLISTSGLRALATRKLLGRVIRSETMRGWVGKRSRVGLDAILQNRVEKLESLLSDYCDDATIESIFSVEGLYDRTPLLMSAESEVVALFAEYHHAIGDELNTTSIENVDLACAGAVSMLLRGFCRYSVANFNAKYKQLVAGGCLQTRSYEDDEPAHVQHDLTTLTRDLIADQQCKGVITTLLSEIRLLNFVNLNLEVKYSFKGWAGMMHSLVFQECGRATGISTDVYAMASALKLR